MTRAPLFFRRLLFAALLPAAAPGWAGAAPGALEVRVKDHREAIDDFSALVLKLEGIEIKTKPGLRFWRSGWKRLPPAVEEIDLARYRDGRSVAVFKGPVDAGSFEAIHLKLGPAEGILKRGGRAAAVKNLIGPIQLPFTVDGENTTRIVLDLVVLDMKDHPPRGYELGVRGYELYTNGKLVDKIPPGP